jgi:hypothetical protein
MTVTITQTGIPSRSKMAGPCWIRIGATYASTAAREIDAVPGDIITAEGKLHVRRASGRSEELRETWQLRVTGSPADTAELTVTPYGQTVTAVMTGAVLVPGEA